MNLRCAYAELYSFHNTQRDYSSKMAWPQSNSSKLLLVSTVKMFQNTHYHSIMTADESSFIVANAFKANAFNFGDYEFKYSAEWKLPFEVGLKAPYNALNWAIQGTSHTQNQVLAKQSTCPAELHLREFVELGSLRAGEHLQIRNIVRCVAERSLSFDHPGVLTAIRFIVTQLGPRELEKSYIRDWKIDFKDEDIVQELCQLLQDLLSSMEENWERHQVIQTAIVLARSMLVVNPNHESPIQLLRKCRLIAENHLAKIQEAIREYRDISPEDSKQLQKDLLAVTGHILRTFDVESPAHEALLSTHQDVLSFLKAIILIGDNTTLHKSTLETEWFRISLAQQTRLQHLLQKDKSPLTELVSKKWTEANSGTFGTWELLEPHWWKCVFTKTSGKRTFYVSSLVGSFLVDGATLNVLPKDITNKPEYTSLFGKDVFNVVPGSEANSYSTVSLYSGHQFKFLSFPKGLVIQQEKNEMGNKNTEILQLVPRKEIEDFLPSDLATNYSHWYSPATNKILFRPASWKDPGFFDSAKYEIVLEKDGKGRLIHLVSGHQFLDMKCHNFLALMKAFLDRIESPRNVHMLAKPNTAKIEVYLPEYNIHFDIAMDSGVPTATVREFGEASGMKVAASQDIGTLMGLSKCVILESDTEKKVLVPFVSQMKKKISPPYFVYDVDPYLCQLRGASTSAWLYLAYLHATTAIPFKDPFTQLTGVESAVLCMRRCWTNQPYDEASSACLRLILSLAPRRSEYAFSGSGLEQVEWAGGHDLLAVLCVALWKYSVELKDLFPHCGETEFPQLSMELTMRAVLRWQDFYPPHIHLTAKEKDLLKISLCKKNINPLQERTFPALKTAWNLLNNTMTGAFLTNFCSSFAKQTKTYAVYDVSSYDPEDFLMAHWAKNYESAFLTLWNESLQVGKRLNQWRLLLCGLAMKWATVPEDYLETLFIMAQRKPMVSLSNCKKFQCGVYMFKIPRKQDQTPVENYFYSAGLKDGIPQYSTWPLKFPKFSVDQEEAEESLRDLVDLYELYYKRRQFYQLAETLKNSLQLFTKKASACKQTVNHIAFCNNSLAQNQQIYVTNNNNVLKPELSSIFQNGSFQIIEDLFASCVEGKFGLDVDVDAKLKKIKDELIQLGGDMLQTKDKAKLFQIFERKIALEEEQKQLEQHQTKHQIPPFPLTNSYPDSEMGKEFFKDLQNSWKMHHKKTDTLELKPDAANKLNQALELAKKNCNDIWEQILELFKPKHTSQKCLNSTGIGLNVTPLTILPKLCNVNGSPAELIGAYAVLLTYYQKAQRCLNMLQAANNNANKKVVVELVNGRCWSPQKYPEWLLFEIEQNLMIRKVQVMVAEQLADQQSKGNHVMQLNMGEGKTSVIIPILCASLANRKQAVRVTVLPSLFATNYAELHQKLSGLLGRSIFTFPCHRDSKITPTLLSKVLRQYNEAKELGGCILTVPEHRLSFMLKHTELVYLDCKKDKEVIEQMDVINSWIEENVFDLLDESDEILRHKYQLIYTIGEPQRVDGEELRWLIVQDILEIIFRLAPLLAAKFPDSFEFREASRSSNWPSFRVIDTKEASVLTRIIVNEIMEKRAAKHVPVDAPSEIRAMMESCFTSPEEPNKKIQELPADKYQAILIVRGLLNYNILIHALSKRWSVDYGVNNKSYWKKLSAVPFRAKDTASERTEFGHPDVAIILTHLSYYSQGLSREQARNAFERLRKESNPKMIYDAWVQLDVESVKKDKLVSYESINLNDSTQMLQLYKIFHKNIRTVNYWLSRAVMPTETKQFHEKLATNSWDLAIESPHPVRGFSGTKDNKLLLPLFIKQKDIPELLGTDGQVIANLLSPENREYHDLPKACSSEAILQQMLQHSPKGRVLIDCGALMVDLTNKQVVQIWMQELKKQPQNNLIEGAVFFEENNLMTLDQHGNCLPFVLSPLRQRLQQCVIYLDDHHTRGTDLKIPVPSHAWVTIGPGLPKDKLVQACMRMRQLGIGHSVSFWAAHEVNLSLKQLYAEKITSKEVLEWCILNTIQATEKAMLQWASQGFTFAKRFAGRQVYKETKNGKLLTECSVLPEIHSLEKLFGKSRIPQSSGNVADSHKVSLNSQLFRIFKREWDYSQSTAIGKKIFAVCEQYVDKQEVHFQLLEDEQERELEQEIEEEREVIRPPDKEHLEHEEHELLANLIEGQIPDNLRSQPDWRTFLHPLFAAVKSSSVGDIFDPDAWSPAIMVTKDSYQHSGSKAD